jgi:hypothetical protein
MEITKKNISKLIGKEVSGFVYTKDKKTGVTIIKVNPSIKEESIKIKLKIKS